MAGPFSFDDIEFWVGSGANRAALVIDWAEDSTEPPALAWGYRWDGAASGSDMLAAIVAADPRLFARLGGTPTNPAVVYGLGYDADGDGEFGIDDGTEFDQAGFAFTGPADLAMATEPDDYYAEGWFTGFWHYGVAAENPYDGGTWSSSTVGMASRTLADGAWDSWAFMPSFDSAAFADNPQAAMPPFAPPGDFNGDGEIDAVDYGVWKSSFGSSEELAADANRNGIVDAADYTIWRDHLGAASDAASAVAQNVPEPTTAFLVLGSIALLTFRRRSNAGAVITGSMTRFALKGQHAIAQGAALGGKPINDPP